MSYYYKLTTAKSLDYLKKELKFINKNYNFINSILRKISFFIHIFYWQGLFKFYRTIDLIIKNHTNLPFFIHKNKIELEITTKCNMKCYHCDRSCRQAPSDELMTLEQIKYFVDESVKANKKWSFIVLIGGEPTLHPDIYEICNIIINYKLKYSPNTKITISTNGVSPKTKETLANLPEIIHQENSSKTSIENTRFFAFNIAPVDTEKYNNKGFNFSKGCQTASNAGTALTRYGYYACGACASNDRVLGLNIGIKNLKDITEKKFRTQLDLLCRYCGIFGSKIMEDCDLKTVSPTWQEAYAQYAKQKPTLTLFGNSDSTIVENISESARFLQKTN